MRIAVVPRPTSVIEAPGTFRLTARTPIVICDEQLRRPAEIFVDAIAALTGFVPTITTVNAPAAIVLHLTPGYKPEEYRLVATRKGVDLTASTPQAILHGLRTLQQLVGAQGIPACTIEDRPCFAYRGAMLDVSRHFFPVEEVKTYIDLLSLHKINRFHWHLTDDQGWRIEIRSYPQLTAVGSRRAQTLVGRYSSKGPNQYDGIPYGGYYTQDDIREIVRYAAERHIEVIPEIEMPGHGLAALASYPWLGCTGGPYEVWTRWGISDDVYCAGKETTFRFIEEVLTEVLELFPSKLIHIGGDECPKKRWKSCPLCQQRIREEGLKDEHELQSYFVRRIEKWLQARGREIIGWDEILQGGISKSATIMSWNGQAPGIKAARLLQPDLRSGPVRAAEQHPLSLRATGLPTRSARPARPAPLAADSGRAVQSLDGVHRRYRACTAHGVAAYGSPVRGRLGQRPQGVQRFRKTPPLSQAYLRSRRLPICSLSVRRHRRKNPDMRKPADLVSGLSHIWDRQICSHVSF